MVKTIVATTIGVVLAAAIIAGSVKGYNYVQCQIATKEEARAYKWYQEDKAADWAASHWRASYAGRKQACGG